MKPEKIEELCNHLGVDISDLTEEEVGQVQQAKSRRDAEAVLRTKTAFLKGRISKHIKAILNKPLHKLKHSDLVYLCNKGTKGDLLRMFEILVDSNRAIKTKNVDLEDRIIELCGMMREAIESGYVTVEAMKKNFSPSPEPQSDKNAKGNNQASP